MRRRVAVPYVSLSEDGRIAGFYTLSADVIRGHDLPPEMLKRLKLPSYDRFPATLIGGLARDVSFKRSKPGERFVVVAFRVGKQQKNCFPGRCGRREE